MSNLVFAAEKPTWTARTPATDANNFYFVGRASQVADESEGIALCEKDAKEQLIKQEFGTEIKIDSSQSESLTEVSIESKIQEVSDKILLKGFKRLEVFTDTHQGKGVVLALFSVPKVEIKNEMKRLADLRIQKAEEAKRAAQNAEAQTKQYDNGGKLKLKKGLKKSQVIAMFGTPGSAESDYFHFSESEYCPFSCMVWFDTNGRVTSWSEIKPEYTTDLDDKPAAPKSAKRKNKTVRAVTASSPDTSDFDPDAFIAAAQFEAATQSSVSGAPPVSEPTLRQKLKQAFWGPDKKDLKKVHVAFERRDGDRYYFRVSNLSEYPIHRISFSVVGKETGHSDIWAFDAVSNDRGGWSDCVDDTIIAAWKNSQVSCVLAWPQNASNKKLFIEGWPQSVDFKNENQIVSVEAGD